jgi:4-diphosphocytidyl-2-C-methyl-D-erythritol kinase
VATSVAYRSYAKINLYLDVVSRRRDGYHNIETVFQTVNLSDRLTFTEREAGIFLDCDAPELGGVDTNLAYRAATLLQSRTGCTRGVHIRLDKNIPIAAGLAGGSGDAAATLRALDDLWDLRLPAGELRRMALELGSDVPYCLVGGTMAATGRGEELSPLEPLPPVWFVLVHPPVSVSTARVYSSPRLRLCDSPRFAGRTAAFRDALYALEKGRIEQVVFNRMEEVVFPDHPTLAEVKQALLDKGCLAAAMSGSGPTLFGVCGSRRDATRVAESLTDFRTSVVASVPLGVERD